MFKGFKVTTKKALVSGLWTSNTVLILSELRIHKDIERGDNDTVKNPLAKGGKVKVAGV